MPRPRVPLAKAQVSGAVGKNAGRFRDRKGPKRTKPLGKPYAAMNPVECGWWEEYAGNLPWLHSGHRVLLFAACRLTARLEAGEEFGVSAYNALSSLLSKLGATPSDETKVAHGDDDGDEDPAEGFFARQN